jgi:hypothetical protein
LTTKKKAALAGVLALVGAMAVQDVTLKTELSRDGQYRASWIQHWTLSPPGFKVEMFSEKLPAGPLVKLNIPMPPDDDVTLDSFIASDSKRVAYRAGNTAGVGNRFQLYSVPIHGGASVRLNQTVAGQVDGPIREVYPVSVRYCGDFEVAGGATTCWVTRINGGGPRYEEIFSDGLESKGVTKWN